MPEPYYDDGQITIYCGDCRDILPTLEAGGVDLAFFDPPYGLEIAAWDVTFDTSDVAATCYTMLSEAGSLYATCSAHILPEMMSAVPYRRIIAWGKPNLPLRKHLNEWEWSTEFVLWATKTDRFTFNKPSGEAARDYWRIPIENGFLRPDTYHHPARKPMDLLKRIILASTVAGDLILDPFGGSGTTARVAKDLGRRCIIIEREEKYCKMIAARLAQQVLPLTG